VKEREAEGRETQKSRVGSHHVVYSDAVRDAVVSRQESDAALRLRDLQHAALPATHSLSTVHNMLREAGFTTKHMQPYANDRNTAATKEKRQKWVLEQSSKLKAETAVFIDESPFSMTLMRGRGRSRKGVPALGVVPAIRGKNHSVIAAISPALGLLHCEIKVSEPEEEFINKRSKKKKKKKKTGPRGVTREIFRTFLAHLFATAAFANASTPFVLCFDNARIHKGDIEDTIFQAGHVQVPLPAWSPELNPIEYIFFFKVEIGLSCALSGNRSGSGCSNSGKQEVNHSSGLLACI
jgi:hypothetical protein